MTLPHPQPAPTTLVKALGRWDVVAMNIVAVVSLRWIARAGRIGAPSLTLWLLAWAAFFIPLAAALVELSSRHPEQGGIYAWVRRAFGTSHGFICGWCLWVNNLFYFPSLLLFSAANFALALGPARMGLADDRVFSVIFVVGFLWFATFVNIIGLATGKWVQHIGNIATWVPPVFLVIAGAIALATFGSATSFAAGDLLPGEESLATVTLWSSMCFAFSGLEIASMVGQEIKDPRRTIANGIMLSGVAITAIYVVGTIALLVALPATALAERSGIADAVDLVGNRVGLAGAGALTGLMLAVAGIGCTNSWVAGAARVPFAAGVDAALPAAFARLHPRFRTPHVALIVQAIAATALFLASVFVSLGGGRTTVQEAYDIMVNLTILVYFVPYLYLFAAWVTLRRREREVIAGAIDVPGGQRSVWAIAAVGFLATFISIVLVFLPPPGTTNVLNYELNVWGQSLLLLLAGVLLRRWGRA